MNILEGIIFIILSIIFIIPGVLCIKTPEKMAMFGERWKYTDANPSEMYIDMTRIGGIILLISGFILFLVGIFKLG